MKTEYIYFHIKLQTRGKHAPSRFVTVPDVKSVSSPLFIKYDSNITYLILFLHSDRNHKNRTKVTKWGAGGRGGGGGGSS